MMIVTEGSTNVTTYFHLRLAADGTDATGLTITNIDLQYTRSGAAPTAKVDATALAAADSAHSDNTAFEIDATDQPGVYRVDWPDAAFAAGVNEVILTVKVATAFTESLRVRLVSATRGLAGTALPNAAADAAGGLPISDAGGLDLDAQIGTDIDAILVDTGTTLQNELDGIQADTEDIQSKLGTPSDLGSGATVAANLSDIEAQTDDIGVAGAGLTAINLPDQTMNITGNITGNLSGSVGSVTGNVGGNVTGSVGSVAAGGITAASIATDAIDADALAADAIAEINATVDTALTDIHLDHLLAVSYDPQNKPGDTTALLNELVEPDNASPTLARFTANALEEAPTGGSAPTAAEIADAVWEEAIADHSGTAGSTAEQLAAAGSAGDPWATALPGSYTSGQAGKIVGDNVNATISSRATQTSVDTIDGIVDSILVDTAEIGAAGAGLTAINLPDQTMNIVGNITGNLSGSVGSVTGNVGGNVTGSVGSVAAGGITASSIATDAITADKIAADAITSSELAASAVTEIQSGLATSASLTTVEGKIDTIDTNVDSILVDTAEIGAAGAGLTEAGGTGDHLTAVPWNASWDAEVQSEVADALEAAIADSVPADGSIPSIKQALYMITQFLLERSVSGTTVTVKKADGSTTLLTLTLDDATTPTSITRAT